MSRQPYSEVWTPLNPCNIGNELSLVIESEKICDSLKPKFTFLVFMD
jgi:hypothetical protein